MLSKWRDLTLLGEVEHCELHVQLEGEHRELNVQLEDRRKLPKLYTPYSRGTQPLERELLFPNHVLPSVFEYLVLVLREGTQHTFIIFGMFDYCLLVLRE